MEDPALKEKRHRYMLHHNLRSKGNEVDAKTRTVTRRAKKLPEIEEKWISELVQRGYCVGNGLFTPPVLTNVMI